MLRALRWCTVSQTIYVVADALILLHLAISTTILYSEKVRIVDRVVIYKRGAGGAGAQWKEGCERAHGNGVDG